MDLRGGADVARVTYTFNVVARWLDPVSVGDEIRATVRGSDLMVHGGDKRCGTGTLRALAVDGDVATFEWVPDPCKQRPRWRA